jgi:hypothetical protein
VSDFLRVKLNGRLVVMLFPTFLAETGAMPEKWAPVVFTPVVA